jgi:hypothetical protein
MGRENSTRMLRHDAGIMMHFNVDCVLAASLAPTKMAIVKCWEIWGTGIFTMKNGLSELAGSSAPIAHSETQIARQRVLISQLHAQGKPTATAEQVLAQIESNLRLMHKVHQFISVRKPQCLPRNEL